MAEPALLPDYTTPAVLAGHFGVTERTLRELVRAHGLFAKIGRKMILYPEHVDALKEAMKCPSSSTAAAKSGTTEAPLPEGDYEALRAQRTKPRRKGSKRKPRQQPGQVISMGRGHT